MRVVSGRSRGASSRAALARGASARPARPGLLPRGRARSAAGRHAGRAARRPTAVAVGVEAEAEGSEDGNAMWEVLEVEHTELEGCRVQAEVTVPAEIVDFCWAKVVEAWGGELKLPGFRKGAKIPESMVIDSYGEDHFRRKILEDILFNTLAKALDPVAERAVEESEQILSDPDELLAALAKGQPLTYRAAVDVVPQPKWKGAYTGLRVEVEDVTSPELAAANVEAAVRAKQKEVSSLSVVQGRPLAMGDVAVLKIKCVKKGTDIPMMDIPPNGVQVDTEDGSFIEGFMEQVVGMDVGEKKSFELTFPETWDIESMRGVASEFEVEVREMFERELPELDEEFAAELVPSAATMEEARAQLLAADAAESREALEKLVQETLLDALAAQLEVEVPKSMVVDAGRQEYYTQLLEAQATGRLTHDVVKQLSEEAMVMNYTDQNYARLLNMAMRSLAIDTLARDEDLQVTEEQFNAELAAAKAEFDAQGQEYDENQLQLIVTQKLETEITLDWLLKHSEVEVVPHGGAAK